MDVELHKVGKAFLDHWVFRDLSYEFKAGGSYLILGPNGSGKSTLLSLLAGFVRPSTGEISYQSTDNGCPPPVSQMGWVAPYLDVPEDLTVLESMALYMSLSKKAAKLQDILSEAGLRPMAKHLLSQLSSGMRQRTLLAMVFGKMPKLLLLDEPLNHLDESSKSWCKKQIQACTEQGTLVLVCSQDPQDSVLCKYFLEIQKKLA